VTQRALKSQQEEYDRDYFEDGLNTCKSAYINYRWLAKRTYREVRAVIHLLNLEPRDRILDFGCAKGFWVKALRHYGIDAWGIDISDYALKNCDPEISQYLSKKFNHANYKALVSRNTLEHLHEKELAYNLRKLKKYTNLVFFTAPLCKKNGGSYIIPIAELDITHKIRWTAPKWIEFCIAQGWKKVRFFHRVKGIHEGWERYPKGNGFFILEK